MEKGMAALLLTESGVEQSLDLPIAVVQVEEAKIESGELLAPEERRIASWERMPELSEAVCRKVPGRERPTR
jgi:hypothetical protein